MNVLGMIPSAVILLGSGPWLGKAAFAGVFVLLLVWLLFMPARLIDEDRGTAWWRSARWWAVLICSVQIAVYLYWG
ncbi:MAG: hypothetical protein JW818_08835 [Pirellulales bacterium]|nr:hypothetical protein [Pirellulales bacterium]